MVKGHQHRLTGIAVAQAIVQKLIENQLQGIPIDQNPAISDGFSPLKLHPFTILVRQVFPPSPQQRQQGVFCSSGQAGVNLQTRHQREVFQQPMNPADLLSRHRQTTVQGLRDPPARPSAAGTP